MNKKTQLVSGMTQYVSILRNKLRIKANYCVLNKCEFVRGEGIPPSLQSKHLKSCNNKGFFGTPSACLYNSRPRFNADHGHSIPVKGAAKQNVDKSKDDSFKIQKGSPQNRQLHFLTFADITLLERF